MKKKVLHFIYALNEGGAQMVVTQYALHLNRELFDVRILVCKHIPGSIYEKILKDAGINVTYLSDEMNSFLRHDNKFLSLIKHVLFYGSVKKYICNWKPDIIHSHLPANAYIKYALKGSNFNKQSLCLIHSVHSEPQAFWSSSMQDTLVQKLRRKYDFWVVKWLVKHYGMRFIALHDRLRQELNAMFSVQDSIVVNNGIDFSRYTSIKPRSEIRAKLGISETAYVVGHVGRFAPCKNHNFLVEVFYELSRKKTNSFLLMVGSGPELSKIQAKLQEKGLAGKYLILENRSDVPDLLNAMDCFVFPSTYEGLGIAVIEAQKAGLPCFVSTGVPEDTRISNLINFIPLSSGPAEWADKIISYCKPKTEYYNVEQWDIKNTIEKLKKIYLREI